MQGRGSRGEGGGQERLPLPRLAPFGILFLEKLSENRAVCRLSRAKGPSIGPEPLCPRASQRPILMGTKKSLVAAPSTDVAAQLEFSLNCGEQGVSGQTSFFFVIALKEWGWGFCPTLWRLPQQLPPPRLPHTLRCLCSLCSKENFDSIPDLEFNPIRGKIVHAFFDKR